jgi:hypothetical protein
MASPPGPCAGDDLTYLIDRTTSVRPSPILRECDYIINTQAAEFICQSAKGSAQVGLQDALRAIESGHPMWHITNSAANLMWKSIRAPLCRI